MPLGEPQAGPALDPVARLETGGGGPFAGVAEWPFALLAIAAPLLLAWNVPPSSTFLNQALSIAGWGVFLWAMLAVAPEPPFAVNLRPRGMATTSGSLLILCAAALVAWLAGRSPASLSFSATGLLLATLLTVWAAATLSKSRGPVGVMGAFCIALLVAGVLSAGVSLVQVFAPDWADGQWIAASALPGRAAGNLRQPNHLSSLTLWALVALAWLAHARRVHQCAAAALALLLVLSVVLSFSRTGTVGIILLGAWGLLDRRVSRPVRWGLISLPVWYAVGWLALTQGTEVAAGGAARFSTHGDVSSTRFAIWSNTLDLIAHRPWAGVGFGDFNFAWTLTPFPDRPVAFFDHTHNLPLQLAVELGLPIAVLLVALLGHALWRAFRAAAETAEPESAAALRCAFMMVMVIVIHSLLEYPLWYAYFLLPTAFALGLCLGGQAGPAVDGEPTRTAPVARAPWLKIGAALMAAGGLFSVFDYWKVVVIFAPGTGAAPLAERIEDGKRSVFFAHHAHYAAATTAVHPSEAMDSFKVASHFLLDTRLMLAWAKAWAEAGDLQHARHIADRLREFNNSASQEFLEACRQPVAPGAAAPFQCVPATQKMDDRDFR